MEIKTLLLTLLVLFSSSNAKAVNIDSVINVTKTTNNDSVAFNAYNTLVRFYIFNNIDSVNFFLEAQNELLLNNNFSHQLEQKYLIDWYTNSGVYHKYLGEYTKAVNYYKKALNIAKQINDKNSVATEYNNIANIHFNQGNYLIAIDNHHKALKIRKEIKDTAGIAMSLGNIGIIHESRKEYDKAITFYKESKSNFELLNNKQAVAWCDRALGVAYLDKNELQLSEKYLKDSYKISKQLNNYEDMKYCLINLSTVFLKKYEQNHYPQTLDSLNSYIALLDSINQKSKTDRTLASLYFIKSKYHHLTHHNNSSLTFLDSAETIMEKLELKNELKDVYELKSLLFEEENNFLNALIYQKKFKSISDEIFNIEKEKELGRKEAWFEYQQELNTQKNKHLNQQKRLKTQQKEQKLILLIVVLLFIIVLIIFAVIYLRKHKNIKQLQSEQKVLINKYDDLETAYNNIHKNLSDIKEKSIQKENEIQIKKPLPSWIKDLSKREIEVLSCLAIGLTDKEIEQKLFISVTTIRTHCRNIYRKLLVKNRVEAANIAKEYGII